MISEPNNLLGYFIPRLPNMLIPSLRASLAVSKPVPIFRGKPPDVFRSGALPRERAPNPAGNEVPKLALNCVEEQGGAALVDSELTYS
ncbi:unnamed protein product [Urochloa humidicola]